MMLRPVAGSTLAHNCRDREQILSRLIASRRGRLEEPAQLHLAVLDGRPMYTPRRQISKLRDLFTGPFNSMIKRLIIYHLN